MERRNRGGPFLVPVNAKTLPILPTSAPLNDRICLMKGSGQVVRLYFLTIEELFRVSLGVTPSELMRQALQYVAKRGCTHD